MNCWRLMSVVFEQTCQLFRQMASVLFYIHYIASIDSIQNEQILYRQSQDSFFKDYFFILFKLILKSFIYLDNSSPLPQNFISLFEAKMKLIHNIAAQHRRTSRHPSFTVNENIFLVFKSRFEEILYLFKKVLYFDILIIFGVDEQMSTLKPKGNYFILNLLFLIRFLIHNSEDGSN